MQLRAQGDRGPAGSLQVPGEHAQDNAERHRGGFPVPALPLPGGLHGQGAGVPAEGECCLRPQPFGLIYYILLLTVKNNFYKKRL